MKSKEFFQQLIDGLTELEMTDLMEASDEYINRNQWGDLREQVFSDRDELEALERNLGDANDEIETLEDELKDAKQAVSKALVDLETAQKAVEDDHPGWEIPELDNAIRILEDI